jgi:hypothetical protein
VYRREGPRERNFLDEGSLAGSNTLFTLLEGIRWGAGGGGDGRESSAMSDVFVAELVASAASAAPAARQHAVDAPYGCVDVFMSAWVCARTLACACMCASAGQELQSAAPAVRTI